jgi:hypothetical protein
MLTPILVATLGFALAPGKVMAAVWLASCMAQTVGALASVKLLRGSALAWYYAPLEIARSCLAVLCWIRACASRRITWRGHPFLVLRGSAIVPDPSPGVRMPARLLARFTLRDGDLGNVTRT